MRILFDGVTPGSNSGPNSFARKLQAALSELGHSCLHGAPGQGEDVRLAFIQCAPADVPTALRLDGIYFNTRQDWKSMNELIRRSYVRADMIVHQTDFDKRLIESYFGSHPRTAVIRNACDPGKSMATAPLVHSALDSFEQTWACASSWRPHKRLAENVRYFRERAGLHDCLVIAGDVTPVSETLRGVDMSRVFLAGNLDQTTLTALYRRTSHLVHLAWLDHCPNVVVDARAAGCRIVCSSSGGTEEVAGPDAIVVEEDDWDLSPLDLYSPPSLDFRRSRMGRHDHLNDMTDVARRYVTALESIAR